MSIRHEIENALAQYALAYDSGDLATVEKIFAPDAVFTMDITDGATVGPLTGRDEIMGLYRGASESHSGQGRHITTNVAVDALDDTTAKTTCYLLVTNVDNGELTPVTTGVYIDEWSKDGGSWQLTKRHIDLDRPY
ncbi:DUF4440 domain-containing protein [Gordonia sp. HNM0687]|uniref:DUF4440 domain-containing protein n=1 Tax=Gordonia mangrovi TaxID=2665643 RepID=A0A6L7GW97_9ACTN|nr:nuclear transport factor 2 family protein [Gordonia mangrovi]MXP24246.1 DUF4440 domain-containing protein [Gordonia mangrovi]UVF79933.1 nuclear transport factor 2 family protein [Gordonia mangrovi]